jgi:hypothetical protein
MAEEDEGRVDCRLSTWDPVASAGLSVGVRRSPGQPGLRRCHGPG